MQLFAGRKVLLLRDLGELIGRNLVWILIYLWCMWISSSSRLILLLLLFLVRLWMFEWLNLLVNRNDRGLLIWCIVPSSIFDLWWNLLRSKCILLRSILLWDNSLSIERNTLVCSIGCIVWLLYRKLSLGNVLIRLISCECVV